MRHYTRTSVRDFLDTSPQIGARVMVDPSAVVLGDVVLDDDVSIWPQVTVRGDVHHIRIGARTSIQDGSVLHVSHAGPYNPDGWPLIIGCDVTVGHAATLHGCRLGDRILVGMGAVVMDGAEVKSEVIIAAGALVTPGKSLRSGYLYAGSPAREIRELTEQEREHFEYNASHYVKLKNEHLQWLEAEPAG